MCGICGEIVFGNRAPDPEAIAKMAAAMQARGPDGGGLTQYGRVAFGHRRLKIIDLSESAAQPMLEPVHELEIVFNGCIYNYRDLRTELESKGYRFFSSGDTEVVVKAYHAWGPACVERFYGMFAFAIHERRTGRLVLARDRFGIKPLYMQEAPERVRFASSLPALLAGGDVDTTIDRVALTHYMTFHTVVPAPRTIIKGISKLPPATLRIIEPDGAVQDHCYWQAVFERDAADANRSMEDWREMVGAALGRAVERRMVADVPVGVLLSGGLDSSIIVALLAAAGQTGLMTFSVGFEAAHGEEGDEFAFSDRIAQCFETNHHKIEIKSDRLLAALPGAIAAMSEPMASHDNIGFYLLAEEVSKHIKVVQSGQGADEVFAGYHWYPPLHHSKDIVSDYAKVFFDRNFERLKAHLAPEWHCAKDEALAFASGQLMKPGAQTSLDRALRLDLSVMLVDDPVKRVDNMTMAWGLEARVPFLDHELVELAARIPPEHKLARGGKGVLKAVADHLLPSDVIDRPKGYFPVPALKYLDGLHLEQARDALHSQAARQRGLFRQDYLEELLASPKEHLTPLRGSELWQVALLELWLQSHDI